MTERTKEWIDKAESDFVAISRLKEKPEGIYDIICFHAQQCVEKYLKAILQENGVVFEKTHDLWHLAKKCISFLPEINDFKSGLIKLTEYAVETRYPGVEATKDESEEAYAVCKQVRRIIRKYFGLEVEGEI